MSQANRRRATPPRRQRRDAPTAARRPRGGVTGSVLVLSGYGLRIAVERGHLVLQDGIADRRRRRRLSRIQRDITRIAIIGHAGTISLDAIRWLHDVKIPLIHLDTDGRVLALVAPEGPDHPTLRRAQARAVDSELGIALMRDLLRQKIDGQERVLRRFTAGQLALPQMELSRRALAVARDLPSLRAAEAQAAAAYWGAWRRVRLAFRVSDQDRVPEHWLTFGTRASALSGSPRLAVNPANAMLNYLYAILEAEARIALLAVGCDPGVGIQHADQRARDSMACDVMEAIRPEVDAWLLDYWEGRTLRRQDFLELRNGQCRLMPVLARELAQAAGLWAWKLGEVVEEVAQRLYSVATSSEQPRRWAQGSRKPVAGPPLPTPLTEGRRSRSRSHLQQSGDSGVSRPIVTLPTITKEEFLQRVVPALRMISPREIAAKVGLSEAYCAKVRAGRGLPHRRHWEAFAQACQVNKYPPGV